MRTVRFTIIGSGRVARHLEHYLTLLHLPLTKDPLEASHILLAVSDHAIAEVALKQPAGKVLVHFSGALTVPGVFAAHPLMTFADGLMDLAWYKKIPFAVDEGESLAKILPGLPNPWFAIKASERPKYHALVAMAGNFAYLLWRETARELDNSFGIGNKDLVPYLQQVLNNFSQDPVHNLTGPIARRDWATIEMHLGILSETPHLRELYQAFLNLAKEDLK